MIVFQHGVYSNVIPCLFRRTLGGIRKVAKRVCATAAGFPVFMPRVTFQYYTFRFSPGLRKIHILRFDLYVGVGQSSSGPGEFFPEVSALLTL